MREEHAGIIGPVAKIWRGGLVHGGGDAPVSRRFGGCVQAAGGGSPVNRPLGQPERQKLAEPRHALLLRSESRPGSERGGNGPVRNSYGIRAARTFDSSAVVASRGRTAGT
jgi:hypothetical protein